MPTVWMAILTSSGPTASGSAISRSDSSPFFSSTSARIGKSSNLLLPENGIKEAAQNAEKQEWRQRQQHHRSVQDAPRDVHALLGEFGGDDRQGLCVGARQHQRDQELVPDQHEAEGDGA